MHEFVGLNYEIQIKFKTNKVNVRMEGLYMMMYESNLWSEMPGY